ncbi:hypothetical protein FJV46_09490 [Arthrobacter agilis]|uniref:hypothetical protein n=1 Tax=Arthrobacter agilis TaxID=37921 RepID=UPI000F6E6ADD|nr:hypothetical protein [Arthrobacter agilis]TPV24902.1 hypothetical protein FJV46_09490 [Arthrobacter agilis]VDR31067.1 Uncharacterised protein [Arthrobacter agilis]
MIVARKWVAAGSTATLLAGGLFLGAPMASAAPGDAACLQASTQFNAALGAAGVDVAFVNNFEAATAAVVTAAETYAAAVAAAESSDAAVTAQAAVVKAEADYEAATALVATAQANYDAVFEASADPSIDPGVVAAQNDLTLALAAQATASNIGLAATAALEAALNTPAVMEAEAALETAGANADALLAQLSGNEALAAELLGLFKAFLAACDASAIGVDPVTPVVVVPVAPAPAAPVAPVTPGAGTGNGVVAPTGTNKGLNVQTAVVSEDNSPAVALLAALLAVGVAVPVATAARMRRLERAQR